MIFLNSRNISKALLILLFWLLMFIPSLIRAEKYMELEPGISKKSEADRVLGSPTREIVRGSVYDYSPPDDDIIRVSIKFYKQNQIIEKIDVYPKVPYIKSQYKEWFKLKEPHSMN